MNSHLKANGIWISNWRNVWASCWGCPVLKGGREDYIRESHSPARLRAQMCLQTSTSPPERLRPTCTRQRWSSRTETSSRPRPWARSETTTWTSQLGRNLRSTQRPWTTERSWYVKTQSFGSQWTKTLVKQCLLVCRCQTLVTWDGDKLVCVQKGEKANRGWKHWIEGDLLHLVST